MSIQHNARVVFNKVTSLQPEYSDAHIGLATVAAIAPVAEELLLANVPSLMRDTDWTDLQPYATTCTFLEGEADDITLRATLKAIDELRAVFLAAGLKMAVDPK